MFLIIKKTKIMGIRKNLDEAQKLVKELKIKNLKIEFEITKDCIINEYFGNSKFYKLEYCEKNCQYRCVKNQDYKKISDKNLKS